MGRVSYGELTKLRVMRLLEALLAYAGGEVEGSERLNISCQPQADNRLVFRTTLREIELLTAKYRYDAKLTKPQIREALNHCKDFLEILEDNRTKTQGAEDWHFTLKLWAKDKTANLEECDRQWEQRKPTKSAHHPVSPTPVTRNIYQNLPAPTYTEFIGRKAEMKRLLELLEFRHSAHIITVDGIGGVGKTALVVEVAYHCLKASEENLSSVPKFDAIIFTCAKQQYLTPSGILFKQQAQRNLRDIFREIAHTLDQPVITQSAPDEQFERVRQCLAKQPTLLIVDNMETIQDTQNVMSFLYDLPANIKVVITTREQMVFVPIRLDYLPLEDSLKLIQQQAEEKGISLSPEDAKKLYEKTGGVPMAIVYAIGQLCSGYPLDSVMERLAANTGDVAEFCFKESVQGLREEPAHKLLMALAIFLEASLRDAVVEVAGLTSEPIAANHSLARLQQLSLIKQKEDRYSMLSLTREYALAELAAYPEFEKAARQRWLNWYLDYVRKYGGNDLFQFNVRYEYLYLEWGNILALLDWCTVQILYEDIKKLWACINNYLHHYGYWDVSLSLHDWIAQEAKHRLDWATYFEAMKNKSYTLIYQDGKHNLNEADEILSDLWSLRHYSELRVMLSFITHIAILRIRQIKLKKARYWLKSYEKMINQVNLDEREKKQRYIYKTYYQAEIFYLEENYDIAKVLYQEIWWESEKTSWLRFANHAQNWLADIAIKQNNLSEAEELLNTGLPVAESRNDKLRIARYYRSWANLEKAKGNIAKSREWAIKALDGFNRLGMMEDAEKIQALLDCIKD